MDKYDSENRRVQYYSNGNFSDSPAGPGQSSSYASAGGASRGRYDDEPPRRKIPGWGKALIIVALVILLIVLIAAGCSRLVDKVTGGSSEVTADFGHEYIGVLYVQDTIDEYGTGMYDHQYLLSAINAMMYDDDNKGIILYVDTPGGSVYASDELYLKIREYQENTGRPVYSSMQSQATSGGYYISASCDKIFANRNCWTGSIGVTMGTFIDVSELLSDLGIRTETITSGDNKAMGSTTEPMTDEQREIYQSLIDEAYEQFVGIVADGRGMSVDEVKDLADGRIYSASQALDNGLIDEVGTFEDAAYDIAYACGMDQVQLEYFQPEQSATLASLLGILTENSGTDAQTVEDLVALNGTFRLSYISEVRN